MRDLNSKQNFIEAQAHLAAIVASSDDAIISKDLNGTIMSWNAAAERIFGFTAEEAIGKHIFLIIPADRRAEEDGILATLKRKGRVDHFETVRRCKDGTPVSVSLTISPILDASGTVIGASKIARDISERIKIRTELAELATRKDEFLANMSHELRTPMNAVIGLASLLQYSKALPERERKYVDTLRVSADSLMELINDLLDFAKIESGSVTFEEAELNIMDLVEKAISVTNVKAQEKSLRLHVYYAPGLNLYYVSDPLRIQQMLLNLLSNAVKFTDRGSIEVFIHGHAAEEPSTTLLSIEVRDTGIGIAKDKLSVIFDKFTQADSSVSRRFGGSGLGLAITKAVAEKMGGSIRVESEPAMGSIFIVTLPVKNAERITAIKDFTLPEYIPSITRKNVLIVEDYEPNVLVVGSMLELMGYNYDVAKNGLDALSKFLASRYDLILMDVQMHELDGLEATRKIRKIEKDRDMPRTPVIAITAHVRNQDKQECLKAGMDGFIPKPFKPSELSAIMERYIAKEVEPIAS